MLEKRGFLKFKKENLVVYSILSFNGFVSQCFMYLKENKKWLIFGKKWRILPIVIMLYNRFISLKINS